MAGNITFAMIKPYAVKQGFIGPILAIINEAGFRISCIKSTKLGRKEAEIFYSIHKSKPFYEDLVEFMSSGHVIAMILEKENAVEEFRSLIGHTDPAKAEDGTIRRKYATSVQSNAVHGSDSDENALIESDFFFSKKDRY